MVLIEEQERDNERELILKNAQGYEKKRLSSSDEQLLSLYITEQDTQKH